MLKCIIFSLLVVSALVVLGFGTADAQQNLAQQAYGIFEQNCLNCHGEHGAFTEEIIIEHTALIETGVVVPKRPGASALYQRLIEKRVEKRMPLGQPPLSPAAIDTIRRWIQAGAPNWADTTESDSPFITPKKMLETIEKHVNSLAPFDRTYARYFTMTHLYNAGERAEALHAYQRALSKLVNSLSWGREVTIPQAIDPEETIFYIDLRDYEWEIGTNRWTLMEAEYPYEIEFNAPAETSLREKLTNLREEMDCEVPFVHVDWFLSTASLPPLYHDILDLPATDSELEERLEVNVVENLRNAAGKRVWRAGFNDSGVSNNNRVVERHASRYGAYWKSYDFAGSVGTQNIFTHPLSFTHDGGEIVFNLPNGLQAYYLVDASGNRLDAAPISIVSNPAASDPTVRNGFSCIGCHTEGMKKFEDGVLAVIKQTPNPPFDKARALRLYAEKSVMDALVDEDTQRYRRALEATGDVFGGIEPVQRFYEVFQGSLDAARAAAAVGLETEVFLQKIRENASLQNLGLLVLDSGTIKRDTWTTKFSEIIHALESPNTNTPIVQQTERIPGTSVHIPDPNLRAVIEDTLGKPPGTPITAEEMATLERLYANEMDISDLTGLEFATNLKVLYINGNLMPDLSPLAGLTQLSGLRIAGNKISDISPLTELKNLGALEIYANEISDISPLAGLTNLHWLSMYNNPISDLSPLANLKRLSGMRVSVEGSGDLSAIAELTNLEDLYYWGSGDPVPDLSPLTNLPKLRKIDIRGGGAVDLSPLAGLTAVKELWLLDCGISNLSFLEKLTGLERLSLELNNISDVSPLAALTNLKWLDLRRNQISDFSPLARLAETTSISRVLNPGAPVGGPKIEGPWLWVTVPRERLADSTDLLAEASSGIVTEDRLATFGALEGMLVGNNVWTAHRIPPEGSNNINQMLESIDIEPDENNRVVYGSIILNSLSEQNTTMFVGSNDAVKVWLNGELVHKELVWSERINDYQDFFPVILKQGANILLVAIDNRRDDEWSGFFGFQEGTEYTVLPFNNRLFLSTDTTRVHIDDTFIIDINPQDVTDLAGWQSDIVFDPTVLEAFEVNEGDFLKQEGGTTFFQKGTIDNRAGKIRGISSAKLNGDGVSGTGTLLSVTFSAKAVGESRLTLNNYQFGSSTGEVIPIQLFEIAIDVKGQSAVGDVNQDGQVSILDMILVAQHFGDVAPTNSKVDVNRDGVISILDLILVSQHMGESNLLAAPSILAMDNIDGLDPAMVKAWIERAQIEDDGSLAFQEGIAKLQQLLASLIPKETVLLPNYPNPFNPETWIPYQLANPSEVEITIYDAHGSVVRRLKLGHQREGYHTSRNRAAYWDGRNNVGERVASGIYFYQLQTDNVSLLRKMVILK